MKRTRRSFLSLTAEALQAAALVSLVGTQAAQAVTPQGSAQRRRTINGYCWPWTARPGETLDFRVSAEGGTYDATLVRIICADDMTLPLLYKEELVAAPFAGTYPGRLQQTNIGSYVEIEPRDILAGLSSFTVAAAVQPTMLPGGVRIRAGGIPNSFSEPVFQDQHLISRWDEHARRGWALLLDKQGRPAFLLGDGKRVHRTVIEQPLAQDRWFYLAASYDAATGEVRLEARSAAPDPGNDAAWSRASVQARAPDIHLVQAGPLRFGACHDGPGNAKRLKQAMCFNGRLDRVRLARGTLDGATASALAAAEIRGPLLNRIVGSWDFAIGMDKVEVSDVSGNGLHGVTVNLPVRAVAGVDWRADVSSRRERPGHYSAIHFHDDDLYDAEWAADFSYAVPAGLRSGIYAVRLQHRGAEDYIPFFVAPPKGSATAAVALLIPTATYTAYTNITGFNTLKRKRSVRDEAGGTSQVEEDFHPAILQNAAHLEFTSAHLRQLGKGIYSNHSDGTLAGVASQRHPNMTIKPKGITWTLLPDTYITAWLEHLGIAYDIITDDLLHAEGVELLSRYPVVMTGNHPEYYSAAMLDAVETYQRDGGRWMYLGGNGFYWVTSFHSQLPGAMEVRKDLYSGGWKQYELHHAFEDIQGGYWHKNGRSAHSLVGVMYDETRGYIMEGSAPYTRLPDSFSPRAAFIFEGVKHDVFGDYGRLGGGAAGYEVDVISVESGTPGHTLHLAEANQFKKYVNMIDPEYAGNAPAPAADLVFFETQKGGAVFSVGSMAWPGALSENGYDNDVARITGNVLKRFMDVTPFKLAGEAT
jgi:N,N-dimethylformamidase